MFRNAQQRKNETSVANIKYWSLPPQVKDEEEEAAQV